VRLRAMLVVAAIAALVVVGKAQKTPDADWPMYARDLAGTKFSPLTQINAGNVSTVTPAWNVTLVERPAGGRGGPGGRNPAPAGVGEEAGAPAGGRGLGGRNPAAPAILSNPEVTPIVVNGVMYLLAGGDHILALDAATGKEIWRYQLPSGDTTGRGVAYWPGDRNNPERIIFTAGPPNAKMGSSRLIALDAATGKPSEGFGKDGVADIGIPWNGVPVVFKNIVALGATVGETPVGPSGDSRAYDARTGKKLWEFHTVPRAGERGNDTWLNDGWKGRSGVNVWGWYMTVDASRGILYMPVAGPAANYWGGDRPGTNLFANSMVAVDAETGKYRWHFQTVHHDLWDSDMPSPPTLVDITQNGKTIPALASVGKTGYMFILDRTTGKPIFGVEERPVPKGDVPGEWYSPTQPFPVKPPPLTRVEFKKEDMVTAEDTSADHVKACQDLWDKSGGFFNAGPFTPFMFHEDGAPPASTIQFPGGTGGVNWGGPAADPTTGYVFVNAHDTSLVGWIEKVQKGKNYGRGTEGSDQPYDRGSVNGAGPYFTFSAPIKDDAGRVVANLPCQRPPWARLVAVNANTGDIAWQVPLGVTDALPEGRKNTGSSGSAGPIATAGGVVIVGATNDRRIRAFDSKTGKELWVAPLPGQGNANPITYTGKNGKQYVAIVATDSLQVFGLP
jgi:quinoprotein glucose dehydrogenase